MVSLVKGANVNLTKENSGLNKITVGLGWTENPNFDLDASVFMLQSNGVVKNDADFIFYGQKKSVCGSVVHNGDNRTGVGEGDDETIDVDLSLVPQNVEKIVFTVTIHEGVSKRQNFGQVSKAHVRILNVNDGKELVRYDLSEDASTATAMIFAELYRYEGDWKFRAVGQGFNNGLAELANNFGVNVE